ncbi:MAG: aldehyde dehydrogenase family protein [Phycisphaerales bacterium]|nr:aldehyde dehydrogenase family protein [Phycisphaerales bacterium]
MTTLDTQNAQLDSVNPATGAVVGTVDVTPVEAIPAMVERARAAGEAFAALPPNERIDALLGLADQLKRRREELASLITAEMGKPTAEALGEVDWVAGACEKKFADMRAGLTPDHLEDGATVTDIHFDPYGVAAVITPWNFPLGMPNATVVPALAAGNAVLLKPSEETPLIGDLFARILQEQLPEGLVQIVHGDEAQGKALVAADVDLVVFTGSQAAGRHILTACGNGLKRVILELGGKDPLIVLNDADLDKAAQFAVENSFRNCGQVCVSTERIYVVDEVADSFEEKVIERTLGLTVGDGSDEGTDVGPMVNERQKTHVLSQIASAKANGATVRCGGESLEGNWITPTVITGLDGGMDIMTEETFGPVACIQRVADAEAALKAANDTPFGLGGCVFGEAEAESVARRMTAGMIGINRGCGGASGAPFVGARQSGYGFHGGPLGIRQFTQARVVSRPKA